MEARTLRTRRPQILLGVPTSGIHRVPRITLIYEAELDDANVVDQSDVPPQFVDFGVPSQAIHRVPIRPPLLAAQLDDPTVVASSWPSPFVLFAPAVSRAIVFRPPPVNVIPEQDHLEDVSPSILSATKRIPSSSLLGVRTEDNPQEHAPAKVLQGPARRQPVPSPPVQQTDSTVAWSIWDASPSLQSGSPYRQPVPTPQVIVAAPGVVLVEDALFWIESPSAPYRYPSSVFVLHADDMPADAPAFAQESRSPPKTAHLLLAPSIDATPPPDAFLNMQQRVVVHPVRASATLIPHLDELPHGDQQVQPHVIGKRQQDVPPPPLVLTDATILAVFDVAPIVHPLGATVVVLHGAMIVDSLLLGNIPDAVQAPATQLDEVVVERQPDVMIFSQQAVEALSLLRILDLIYSSNIVLDASDFTSIIDAVEPPSLLETVAADDPITDVLSFEQAIIDLMYFVDDPEQVDQP